MRIAGNPLQEDLWEAAEFVHPTDAVTTVQMVNHGDDILHLTTGFLRPAFEEAREVAQMVYGVPISGQVDRIISLVLSPLNRTLYQAQKAMENAKQVLKDGGTFVLVAPCDQGIGTAAFFDRMQALGSPETIVHSLSLETYQFGDHKAFTGLQLARRVELLYLGNLDGDIARGAFMQKISLEELLNLISEWHARGDRILIDEAGGYSAIYLS